MQCRIDYKEKWTGPTEKTTNEVLEQPKEASQQTTANMIAAAIKEGIKDALREIEEIKNGRRTDVANAQSAFPKESTIWDVYVNEARSVDKELVDEWKSSLNFLLVFVSPF